MPNCLYVLDRTTGEVLAADPFHALTSTSGVDLKTGRLRYVADKEPVVGKVVRDICPASPGAKDWNPSAYSAQTGFLYIPHNNLCMDFAAVEANYIGGTPYVGAEVRMKAGPGGHRGEFTAWDVLGRKEIWTVRERFPVWSGALATAGGVVFYGTMEGWFKALDAADGTLLWQFKTGSGIIGQPVTYLGPYGRQYVAVLSGVGGWAGAIVAGGLDARDAKRLSPTRASTPSNGAPIASVRASGSSAGSTASAAMGTGAAAVDRRSWMISGSMAARPRTSSPQSPKADRTGCRHSASRFRRSRSGSLPLTSAR